ncbi:MAG: nucleotidyl transferase AbiEii/AbiGii toxin family protein [Ignavibacterium sp.]|nr:nucleotidyl transferase AbiEii/AbiGii toxin family protein [Ignavibacterium sp.]MDW8374927.1 nucleotidyl transferase AbiEii/AbiGii toxin family protein [Ignavibacteriales bacterium]
MQTLQNLEVLEIEILELLNSIKVLEFLYFGGGTMLRLCHNLNRYSTDLDFWLDASSDNKQIFQLIRKALADNYKLTDSMNKRNTILFEFRSSSVNRSLKIEIRKEQTNFDWEYKIAFSRFTTKQVMVKALTLEQMMKNKFEALISRKIIRDAFDIEFLLMRGINLPTDKLKLEKALQIINNFKEQDYKVTLGSILDEKDRTYYTLNKFKLLKEEITKQINLLK